ncbi:unnamed protein product [Ilex paraguariensis]|uniref:DUF4005 domain-containing protein n=1 Tax=Ilex paraguariensis TaxID=185542 RepID=A0ABC8TVV6_9AQUA
MGRSPGKWIKSVLFGKKASKSKLSKGREITPVASIGDGIREKSDLEMGVGSNLPNDGVLLSPAKQGGYAQTTTDISLPKDSEKIRLEQAATKAQAAFRGYQARRAFEALKGIIRLQAFVRGHLVRRQAVATLYCVQRIVKLQALIRGQKVRRSDVGAEVLKHQRLGKLDAQWMDSCKSNASSLAGKLLNNVFIRQLLSSSPTTMPLQIQYGPGEQNFAWDWLLRWTISHVWGSHLEPKKLDPKDGSSIQAVRNLQGRPKCSSRRMLAANVEIGSNLSTSKSEKQICNLKKVLNPSTKSVQEHAQNEIEKVKKNLKKISNSTSDTFVQPEVNPEKPTEIHKKSSNSAGPGFIEQDVNVLAEKVTNNSEVRVLKPSDDQMSPKQQELQGPVPELDDHPAVDVQCKQIKSRSEYVLMVDPKDDRITNKNQKTSRRRASLPAKHDNQENGSHNTPRIPSYMATTKSAKAKLRGQVSPRFGLEEAEKKVITRRHSLPSSTKGKLSSSPRAQRLVQARDKDGKKSDRSLSSSRDGIGCLSISEVLIQAEWRR